MDKAFEGEPTRSLAEKLGFKPVVPPKKIGSILGSMIKRYKKRNEIERFFRRIKEFRRAFTRYDKLDVMFLAFITFTLIVKSLI